MWKLYLIYWKKSLIIDNQKSAHTHLSLGDKKEQFEWCRPNILFLIECYRYAKNKNKLVIWHFIVKKKNLVLTAKLNKKLFCFGQKNCDENSFHEKLKYI